MKRSTNVSNPKDGYTNLIFQYKYRRDRLRKQYTPWRTNADYLRKVKSINNKMKNYRRAIWRIDKIQEQLNYYNSRVRSVYDLGVNKSVVNLRNLKVKVPQQLYLLRKMYCKYAMEQGIPGSNVSRFIGWKDLTQASRYRLEFTRAMQHNDIIKQQWHKFKKSMDRVPQQKIA